MKRKQIQYTILMLIVTMIFLRFLSSDKPSLKTLQIDDVFDTYSELTIEAGKNSDKILGQCNEYLHSRNNLWTAKNPASDIGKLNANAGQSEVALDPDTIRILSQAQDYSQDTNGFFDVTVGAVVNLWDIGGEKQHVPSNEEITEAIHKVGSNLLQVDAQNNKAFLTKEGTSVTLGAIAKGYATKGLVDILKQENVTSALINLGGNTYAMGTQLDGEPWNVGIQDPLDSTKLIGNIKMFDTAIITSGNYQRYFIQDGIRYHHIFNPYTGKPSNSGLTSVTIISDDPTLADVLSTACFVIGYKESLPLIREFNAMAIFVTEDNTVYYTSQLQNYFEHDNTTYDYVALD